MERPSLAPLAIVYAHASTRGNHPAKPDPKPLWYRLTPDRLVIGLLAVECLLWLSERFQWFAFDQHKGWTVLIAVAVVGGAMLVMLGWFISSLLFRWRFQFSIRSLLVLVQCLLQGSLNLVIQPLFSIEKREPLVYRSLSVAPNANPPAEGRAT